MKLTRMDEGDRPRFIERAQPAKTAEEARQRRSTTMITLGAIALVLAVLALTSGSAFGYHFGLLGVGLLVGGLVIRP